MTLSAFGWQNSPSTSTPLSAAELEAFGAHIGAYVDGLAPTVLLDSYYDSVAYANKSAAIQAAHDAAVAQQAVLECRASRVYSIDTTPLQVKPSSPIVINGNKATFQANWGKPRCIDFARTADYQTFQNIEINDLIFDANNATAITNQSVVGNIVDGGGGQRINANYIRIRRCRWINVPTGAAGGTNYACFGLASYHLAAGETQTNLTDIRVEDAVMRGGNDGAEVFGGSNTGGVTNVEVYHDRIYLDVDHDTGSIPAATRSDANVQVGGLGWGDSCEVVVKGANSGDVGVEIDGMQFSRVSGTVTDAFQAAFFVRNFHAPPDAFSQVAIFENCKARVINILATQGPGVGFMASNTSAPISTVGHVIFENCTYHNSSVKNGAGVGLAFYCPGYVNWLTISRATIVIDGADTSVGSQFPTYIQISPLSSLYVEMDTVRFKIAGSTTSADYEMRALLIQAASGTDIGFTLNNVTFDTSMTGIPQGNSTYIYLGPGSASGTIHGTVRRPIITNCSGSDTQPDFILVAASTQNAISGEIRIEDADSQKVTGGNELFVSNNTNKAKVNAIGWKWRVFPKPSAAMGSSNFAAATFTTATGNQYIGNSPAEVYFAKGTGAAITAIAASKDGTTYENVYEQASGTMGQDVFLPVDNGDYVKVTFTTTQPTTSVRFRR